MNKMKRDTFGESKTEPMGWKARVAKQLQLMELMSITITPILICEYIALHRSRTDQRKSPTKICERFIQVI